MGDIAQFPPPVTGMVRLDAYDMLLRRYEALSVVLRQVERERDEALDRLYDHAEAFAEGRIVGPAGCWTRIAFAVLCTALVVWPLARMVP
jgi:hypothetical protein